MCDLNRRTFLQIGMGATAAASLYPGAFAQDTTIKGTAKAVIMLYMDGGPSQIDTFDPKPGKSTGGEFKAIPTTARGIQIGEHLPRVAGQMKHISIIRSMTSKEGDHRRGQYLVHTGYNPEGAVTHPAVGCYVSHEKGDKMAALPNYISVQAPQYSAAFLKSKNAPYPVFEPGRPIHNIKYGPGVDVLRFNDRMELLGKLEDRFQKAHDTPYIESRRDTYKSADKLMHTPDLRAFDLVDEDDKLRDAYGRNGFGQGCLLARRLVERGVKFVEVGLGGWDTHANNFAATRNLCRRLDPGFATLIKDLKDKDMLKETLVVWVGEFGRTPRINALNGRDHWPNCFSVALAGGGVQGGRVVGETDELGMGVKKRAVSVPDYAATIYHTLGVDVKKKFINESARPIKILDKGAVVKELL